MVKVKTISLAAFYDNNRLNCGLAVILDPFRNPEEETAGLQPLALLVFSTSISLIQCFNPIHEALKAKCGIIQADVIHVSKTTLFF